MSEVKCKQKEGKIKRDKESNRHTKRVRQAKGHARDATGGCKIWAGGWRLGGQRAYTTRRMHRNGRKVFMPPSAANKAELRLVRHHNECEQATKQCRYPF